MRQLTELSRRFAGRSMGLLALFDQGAVSLTNFMTSLILGRIAGKSELGLYAVSWTLITITTEISAALISTPYTVLGPQMRARDRRRYLGSMFMQQIALSAIVGALMLCGVAIAFTREGKRPLLSVVTITAAVIVFISLREFVRRICFAELKVTAAIVLDVSACVAQISGLLLLSRTGHLSAGAAYALLGGLSFLAALSWVVINRSDLCLQPRYWLAGLQHNWGFARWVLLSGFLWAGAMYLYPWLLTAFHGTATTGIWAAGAAIVAAGNPVLLGLGNYLGPRIAHVYANDGIAKMRRLVYRSSVTMAVLVSPLVLGLVVFGGPLLAKMYGRAFRGTGLLVALLALNLLVTAFAFPYSRGLFSLEAARKDTLVNLVAVALLFSVGIAAAKSLAAPGAAAALLLSTVAATATRIIVFERTAMRRLSSASDSDKNLALAIPFAPTAERA